MYTSDDVLDMMDSLPVGERLLVVEEPLRKIRVEASVPAITIPLPVKKYNHPILELAGIWTDEEANEIEKAIEEGNTIDDDEW